MQEINNAYANGDEARLRAILDEWETSPDAVTGDGVAAELVRAIRKIHQVQGRLVRIENEMAELNSSELAMLKARVESKQMSGLDGLGEIVEQLSVRILKLRQQKDAIRASEASR